MRREMDLMPEQRDPSALPTPEAGEALYQFRFADALFDEAKFELRVADVPVTVEPRPLRVLGELLRHANEVVTKEELFESVWEGRVTVDNVLANAVTKLRKALGEAAGGRIVNVPRVGYRLTGAVERIALAVNPAQLPVLQAGLAVPGRANFQLVRALDEGGQGRVWLARQPKTGQERVFKFAVDGQGLASLKREYTLARVLRSQLGPRADLVAVHEAHFSEVPFSLECEHVGPDLVSWESQTQALAGMGVPQRLALFLQVARSVAAAHGLGVLHKDIKPANVLVRAGVDPLTLVLADFGSGHLAQAERVAQWGITALGLTVASPHADASGGGTPMYLAPEVLAGQAATVQSDVYALGVLLYQMLTADLRRPLAGGWQRALDDALLVADVEAATDGDPTRRLESAAALVDRLERLADRHLAIERARTEAARAADADAREQRRRLRRPWQMAASVVLVLGLSASLYFLRQTQRALHQVEEEKARALAIRDFVQRDLFEAPDILTLGIVRPTTMLQVLRRAAATASERFAGRPADEAAMQRRLAEAFMRLASLQDARKALNQALALLSTAAPADDEERLIVLCLSAHLHAWGSRFEDARRELQTAEQLAGPARLQQASELTYQWLRARFELAYWTDTLSQALPDARRLVATADAVFPNTAHLRIDARFHLAEVLFHMGRADEAERLVVEITQPPLNGKNMRTEILFRLSRYEGKRLVAEGRWVDVAATMAAHRQALATDQPVNEYFLAWADAFLASVHHRLGNFAQAQRDYLSAIESFERVNGEGHQYVVTHRLFMAFNLLRLNRHAEATEVLHDVGRWMQAEGKPLFAPCVTLGLAMAHRQQGRAREALALLEGLVPGAVDCAPYAGDGHARIRGDRGLALLDLGQNVRAAEDLQAAIGGLEKVRSWDWLLAEYRAALKRARASG